MRSALRPSLRRGLVALACLAPMLAPVSAVSAAPADASSTVVRMCGDPAPGHVTCFGLRRTDIVRPHVSSGATPPGLSPADLVGAYNLPTSTTPGPTIAIVDAYHNPNADKDLAVYRQQYGLPACTRANGCLRQVNQRGATSPLPHADGGWAAEISLDLDMVSAICPQCHLLLVEADSTAVDDLLAAVDSAVRLGAKYVSNSYGGYWDPSAEALNSHYNRNGVTMVASTGDDGFGPSFPATVPSVTAVGGTSLQVARSASGTTRVRELVWGGAGSGCATTGRRPFYQGDVSTGCEGRGQADVSAAADPNRGVATYNTYPDPSAPAGWGVAGGTSAAAPIIAGVSALAGSGVYTGAPAVAYPYRRPTSLYDVTSGRNGACKVSVQCVAGPGWDGPTGLGSPNGITAFSPASAAADPYVTGGVSVTSWGPGRLDVVARNARKQMIHRVYSGGKWSGWTIVGGILGSQPSVTTWGPNRLDAVALDSAGHLIRAFKVICEKGRKIKKWNSNEKNG